MEAGFAGTGYPQEVAAILVTKCATDGCHNELSYKASGGLNLGTWESLFEGTRTGAVVIPFRADFSPLCYFTNVDSSMGISLAPTMPIGQNPLTRTEYLALKNWIENGAPDVNGNVKFADDINRRKYYITNRLCNVVTVVDAASKLQMRYVNVGDPSVMKFPYCVKVSPDKQYWYVSFFTNCSSIQKFSAADDRLVQNINIGTGSWTSFVITSDSRYGYFVDNSSHGKIAYVDLQAGKLLNTYSFNGDLSYPSGIVLNEKLNKIYLGSLTGNFIYIIDLADPASPKIKATPIDGSNLVQYQSSLNPTELVSDPLTNKCYVACSGSSEIKVLDMATNNVISSIPLMSYPAFLGISHSSHRLFISCPDDSISFPGNRGAVVSISTVDNSIERKIKTGYQPYGLTVDEGEKVLVVVNANISSKGPASHHISICGQKNGNISYVSLNTLEILPKIKPELASFPFFIDGR